MEREPKALILQETSAQIKCGIETLSKFREVFMENDTFELWLENSTGINHTVNQTREWLGWGGKEEGKVIRIGKKWDRNGRRYQTMTNLRSYPKSFNFILSMWEIIGDFWAGRWLGQICMFMKSFWQPEYYNRLLAVFLFCSYLPTIQFQHSSQFHLVKNIIQIMTPAQNLQRLPISEK